jgi:hypothetical protein
MAADEAEAGEAAAVWLVGWFFTGKNRCGKSNLFQ